MTTFSSHLLNSVNGSHASNVEIEIYQIKSNGERKIFYKTKTDNTGRVLKEFDLDNEDCKAEYEMICKTGDYFLEKKVVSEITVKFKMVDPNKKYHIPIIISPNGYTIWWSD